jgi:hypothetical protein
MAHSLVTAEFLLNTRVPDQFFPQTGTAAGGERFKSRNACYVREPDQMPWTVNDAERHTHKATTPALKELWTKVANESLERTGDEGRAIREANDVLARQAGTSK